MNFILRRRAQHLLKRLKPYLPATGRILDVGSGTGHNGAAIHSLTGLDVVPLDVTDMNIVGGPVVLYDGKHIPFSNQEFQAILVLFILHYIPDPVALLQEVRRTGKGPVLIIQSVYSNVMGKVVLVLREYLQGRAAFQVASFLDLVPRGLCPMRPVHYYTREELATVFKKAGLQIIAMAASHWPGLGVSRDLYVLKSGES